MINITFALKFKILIFKAIQLIISTIMQYKQYYVYILFNKKNGTLYVGVTSNLIKRVWEHKNKMVKGFTSKYNVDKLGYFECSSNIISAIAREKQLKAGSRKTKIDLIETNNPDWNDLYYKIQQK